MVDIIKCSSCDKVLAMINKGKIRTDESFYCGNCYTQKKNKYNPVGESMNERDGLEALKEIFGMFEK
jgi:hypothetical protein